MTKDERLALADRCEKGAGADRELDADIYRFIENDTGAELSYAPNYTASIDDALTLVPVGLKFILDVFDDRQAAARIGEGDWHFAESPALAICAAALRAIAQGDAS